ncbi:MAG: hypothetical protein AMJ54_08725 [Deltaproteobacteria bacterium SG8_13]|nr:MAG: hypothetical protein AMJ54_08725 [Deltaproteobacteria bacterium SG8_13]
MPLFLRVLTVFACLMSLAPPGGAGAEGFDLVPNITLREEYNDNIFFSVQDQDSDIITTVSPGLNILERTERLNLALTGRLDGIYYADLPELDAVDQHYRGHLGYQFTERLGLLSDAGYIEDSRPDRDVFETGLVQSAQTRKRRFFLVGGDYRSGDNTSNNLFYRYEQSDYADQQLADSRVHAVDFQHTWDARRFFEETLGHLDLGYANADFSTSQVESVSGTIGAAWNATELWRLKVDLGARYTVTDFLTADTTRDLSGVGKATIEYRDVYTSVNLVFLHDLREARGRGGTAYRTELTGWAGYRLSEKFRLTLSAGYFLNRSRQETGSIVEVDTQTLRVRPGLRYEFTEDLAAEAAYNYTRVRDDIARTSATQNLVFGQLYWQWPMFD